MEPQSPDSLGAPPSTRDGDSSQQSTLPPGPPPELERMNGLWIKSAHESSSMDAVCDAMHLNFFMKRAINLVNRLEIIATDQHVQMNLSSAIPWFKVRETRDGTNVACRLRAL